MIYCQICWIHSTTSCCSRSSHLYHLCTLNVAQASSSNSWPHGMICSLSPLHSPTLWLSESQALCLSDSTTLSFPLGYLFFGVHATTETDRLEINRHVAFVCALGVSREQCASGVTCMARSCGFDTLNSSQTQNRAKRHFSAFDAT